MKQTEEEFKLSEVIKLTGLSDQTIRRYQEDFNIQGIRTQGGHRRFKREEIDMLLEAKRLKEKHGYSIKQIRSHFNGETTSEMLEKNEPMKTVFEKKIVNLEEQLAEATEKIDSMVQVLTTFMNQSGQTNQKILSQFQDVLKVLPETSTNTNNQRILEKEQRLNELKIRNKLKKEAIEKWGMLPEEERNTTVKTGLFSFKREENHNKKRAFIEDYISEHLVDRLEREYDMK
ncbi:DNA binding domain-containing protein, excisionase family [Priestia aryabhattai B8W22]|uniref:helix-turn-helix domain-containing protein n=1 Tax=Priestia aryabhattai TaxID=412384 RepID=UPI00088667DF|nr:DNA binding domain-containing protein, excisionase family [Priestia aryabhattai B8W22]